MRDSTRLGPVERLIDAWLAWEANPGSRPACVEREAAIAELGLPGNATHERIAAARRAGYDVPSACERTVLDLTREAS